MTQIIELVWLSLEILLSLDQYLHVRPGSYNLAYSQMLEKAEKASQGYALISQSVSNKL